jgi:hypothetical protein
VAKAPKVANPVAKAPRAPRKNTALPTTAAGGAKPRRKVATRKTPVAH